MKSILFIIFMISSTVSASQNACEHRLLRELSAEIPSQEVLEKRLGVVLEAQNQLLWSLDKQPFPILPRPVFVRHRSHPSVLVYSAAHPELGTAYFLFIGDLVLRSNWADTLNLNRVYRFRDEQLINTQSFAEFVIQNVHGSNVILIRNLGSEELQLWIGKKIDQLKEKARPWGYGEGVIHFELERRSWIGSHRFETGRWSVPKKTALRWVREKKLSAGIVSIAKEADGPSFSVEIVVKQSAWEELAKLYIGLYTSQDYSRGKQFLSVLSRIITIPRSKKLR